MIRGGGPGTRWAAHGHEWFWALLPKKKCLVVWGRLPTKIKCIDVNLNKRDPSQCSGRQKNEKGKPGSPKTNVGDDGIEEKAERCISENCE